MYHYEVKHTTRVTREQIWKLWADVPNWKGWDTDLLSSVLKGNFQKGSLGVIKPKEGPKVKFEIIECTKLKSFTSRSYLPLCKMDFIHMMEETKDGLEITHKIEMSGPMTFLFSKVIGSKAKVGLPKAIENLIDLAEITK